MNFLFTQSFNRKKVCTEVMSETEIPEFSVYEIQPFLGEMHLEGDTFDVRGFKFQRIEGILTTLEWDTFQSLSLSIDPGGSIACYFLVYALCFPRKIVRSFSIQSSQFESIVCGQSNESSDKTNLNTNYKFKKDL